MDTNKKNTLFIVGFTAILVVIVFALLFSKKSKEEKNNPVAATTVSYAPAQTVGDITATIAADIQIREIDFSMSKEEVQAKEEALDDTLNTPSSAAGTDGYLYITYPSNPENPLKLMDIPVSDADNTGICYVFVNDSLTEVRFQFGQITADSTQALLNKFTADYGEKTFYRNQSGAETYWWKTDSDWLMLTKDTVGTTVYFRRTEQ